MLYVHYAETMNVVVTSYKVEKYVTVEPCNRNLSYGYSSFEVIVLSSIQNDNRGILI